MTTIVPDQTGYTAALDMVDAAYRLVRGVGNTDPINGMDRENAFFLLNLMLDEWGAETLMVPAVVREQFTTCCGQSLYSMGPHGDWDTVRPTLIRDMRVNFGGVDLPVRVIGFDDYQTIGLKTLTTNPPQVAWPDYGWPLCNIRIYPVPGAELTITTICEKPIAEMRGMFDRVSFPPGYQSAIVYNLALRLGAVDATTATIAASAKRQIKARNQRQTTLSVDPALRGRAGRYNILSDSYR